MNVKAQNDELTGFVNKYKEQCDFHGKEMIKAINEKFEARSERELIYQQLREALKEKDETLKRLVMETKEYNLRQEMAIAETQRLKERLMRTEEELISLKKKTSVKYKSSLVSDSNLLPWLFAAHVFFSPRKHYLPCGTKFLRVLIFAFFPAIGKNKFPQIKITANIFPAKIYSRVSIL